MKSSQEEQLTEQPIYNEYISSKYVNLFLILIVIIMFIIKLRLLYQFKNEIDDDDLFYLLFMYSILYFSTKTLQLSNTRLDAFNVILSTLIDKSLETWSVFIADFFIILVVFFTRRESILMNDKYIYKILVALFIMRCIIHLWKLYKAIKMQFSKKDQNNDVFINIKIDEGLNLIKNYLLQ